MIPQQPSTPWQDSFSLSPPSWRRSELLDAVHPVDDLLALFRRIRTVEAARPVGVQASVVYELLLDVQSQLHDTIRLLEPPSTRSSFE